MNRISKSDDTNTSPSTERQIMITGNADSVALAKSLINMSLDLHKARLERDKSSDDEGSTETPSRSRGGRDHMSKRRLAAEEKAPSESVSRKRIKLD